jgi:uncharacterized membrane protein YcaP (DUF421 family)
MLVVLIADAASNGMSGNYDSITDGCILVATIAGWNYLLDWTSFHFSAIRSLVEPPPLALIRDGKLQRKAMRQELISASELEAKLREHGIENIHEIRRAYLEDDGEISLLRRDGQEPEQVPRRSKGKSPV